MQFKSRIALQVARKIPPCNMALISSTREITKQREIPLGAENSAWRKTAFKAGFTLDGILREERIFSL
jgi:hypothetical protein